MKYECSYNSALNIVETVTAGSASMTEMLEMLHCIVELCKRNESANIIVDHSKLDPDPLTTDALSNISRHVALAKDIFKNRKCAHIVAEDFQFGLVRAWETMVELAGVTDFYTNIFKNRADAVEWIQPGRTGF